MVISSPLGIVSEIGLLRFSRRLDTYFLHLTLFYQGNEDCQLNPKTLVKTKDYEVLPETSEAMVYVAMIRSDGTSFGNQYSTNRIMNILSRHAGKYFCIFCF